MCSIVAFRPGNIITKLLIFCYLVHVETCLLSLSTSYYDERRIDITNKCTQVSIIFQIIESCCCIFLLMYSCLHMKRRYRWSMHLLKIENTLLNNFRTLPIHIAGRVASVVIPTMIYSYIIQWSCRRKRPFTWVVWQCVDGKDAVLCICSWHRVRRRRNKISATRVWINKHYRIEDMVFMMNSRDHDVWFSRPWLWRVDTLEE